jgi:putative LysE/RhtB family amino acid efflux pump
MTGAVFASGLVLGVSIAAPVGAMGLLCINRTLQRGFGAGFSVGLGIATGDALYGAIAAFGFAAVTDFLTAQILPLRLIGGAFLIWLGIQAWRSAGQTRIARPANLGERASARDYVVAVGLTLTNPATILSFIAAFGALGLGRKTDSAAWMVGGVFLGSALWWLALCTTISLARKALTPPVMAGIDRFSAVVLIAFGAAAALGLL